jgi:hypothetical protein
VLAPGGVLAAWTYKLLSGRTRGKAVVFLAVQFAPARKFCRTSAAVRARL